MKNLKIILSALVLVLALSACQKSVSTPSVSGVKPTSVNVPISKISPPVSVLSKTCVEERGVWSNKYKECEGVGKIWCDANKGRFDECASACRHDPKADICTMNCVPLCSFGVVDQTAKPEAQVPPVVKEPLVGGDKDSHGCIGSAGYMWCEAKTKCLRIWEEPCWPEVTTALQQAFADKYKKPLADIRVSVGEADATHAKGGVGFSVNGVAGEGGNFLAVKADGKWKIVFEGNGQIACSTLAPYNFPASMIEGFCAK